MLQDGDASEGGSMPGNVRLLLLGPGTSVSTETNEPPAFPFKLLVFVTDFRKVIFNAPLFWIVFDTSLEKNWFI